MKRSLVACVVLVSAAASAIAGFVWQDPDPKAELCEAVKALADEHGARPVGFGGRAVTVLGDSYAEGMGLARPRGSWPAAFAARSGSTVHVDGASGTGFVNPGICRQGTFLERRPAARGLLIVQGGLNDIAADPEDVEGAACRLVARADRTVVVGPPLAPAFPPRAVRAVDAALRRAIAQCGGDYVSTLTWNLTYTTRGIHLDQAGHDRFGRWVAQMVFRPGG